MNVNFYKGEPLENHGNVILSKFNKSGDESKQSTFLSLFCDLKENYDNNNIDNVSSILAYTSNMLHNENHFPPDLDNFLINSPIIEVLFNITKNPLNNTISSNILSVLDELVTLSTRDKLNFLKYLSENGYLELLFSIREFIPINLIPIYMHLVANFTFCSEYERNQILIRFSPDFLEELIIEQGGKNPEIMQMGTFFIWRMTMYSLSKYESTANFIKWYVDFFARIYKIINLSSLRYCLFALDNLVNHHHEINYKMLVLYGYVEIIENFIQSRNALFAPIQDENQNEEDERNKLFVCKDDIDELLEIYLRIILFLIESDHRNISFHIIFQLIEISHENWKKCSPLAIEAVGAYVSASNIISPFDDIKFTEELMINFDSADYRLKHQIISLINKIINIDNGPCTSLILIIGDIVLPNLIQSLNDTSNLNLVRDILDCCSNFLFVGDRSNGYRKNHFYNTFKKYDGFDFLYNYEEKLEYVYDDIEDMIEDVLSFLDKTWKMEEDHVDEEEEEPFNN